MNCNQLFKCAAFLFLSCGWMNAQTISTFEAPGAGKASGQGTFPLTNNPSGAVTGYQLDTSGAAHGFVRSGHDH